MSVHIIYFGKHKFICGLFWQSLSRPRELKKEAIELAKKIDSNLMIIRKDHATAQAGYAHTRDGANGVMYSLGAVISKTLAKEGAFYDGQKQPAHNWLGAFKLPDGMWAYFAVRDANFLPSGDFAGSKEEVLDRLHGDYGLGGWNVVVGDAELEDYGFHNFNSKTIEELIPHKKNGQIRIYQWWKLQQLDSQISKKFILISIAAMFVLLSAGLIGYKLYQKKQQEEQARIQDEAIAAARLSMQANAPAIKELPHPWITQPLPTVMVRNCLEKLKYRNVGGWQLEDYSCNASTVNYSWSRQDSTIGFLIDLLPNAVLDASADKASLSDPNQLSSGDDEALLSYKEIVEPLISKLQLLNISRNISKIIPPPAPPPANNLPGMKPEEVAKPNWDTYSFTINSAGLAPDEMLSLLSQPGIRLNNLSLRNGEWLIQGNIYVKLP